MRSILLIAKRDLKALLVSPLFLLIASFCGFIWSAAFIRSVFAFVEGSVLSQQLGMGAGGNLHTEVILSHVSWVNIVLLFSVPAITMKMLAEEKKSRTFDLLLTLPVTSTEIILGKFIAGYCVVQVLVLIALLFPLGLGFIADVSYGPLLSSFLGLSLMTAVYVSIGLFCSSLTQSLVLSIIMATVFNISLFLLNGIESSFQNPMILATLSQLDIVAHFWQFLKGVIASKSIVFFVSVIVFFIFLTQRTIESMRWR